MKFKSLISFGFFFCFAALILSISCYAADYDGYIVKFKDDAAVAASLDDTNVLTPIASDNTYTLQNETDEYVEYLAESDDVEYIEPNYIVTIPEDEMDFSGDTMATEAMLSFSSSATIASTSFSEPNDPMYSRQWNMTMINAPAGWEAAASSSSVKIGIIDSGDPSHHPDITNNIVTGKYYAGSTLYDEYGHSTFICGVIAADINNNMGVAGIMEEVSLIPLKVFVGSTTSVSYITSAIYDAVDVYDCDVINLSLVSESRSTTLNTAIQYAVKNGIIVVAAVGNSGTTQVYYPAGFSNVIGVGSVTSAKQHADHSQVNSSVDVSAPGFAVYSTTLSTSSGDYTYYTYSYSTGSGTSYASPHVAAAAAIAKYYDSSIDTDDFLEILENTCTQLGGYTEKNNTYGYGLVNIEAIIDYMTAGDATATPAPTATPTASPTATPTAAPTATPTAEPIAEPTLAPEATPTDEPTGVPTAEPTAEPTATPTAEPTATPTAEPTTTPVVYDFSVNRFYLTLDGALTEATVGADIDNNSSSDVVANVAFVSYTEYTDSSGSTYNIMNQAEFVTGLTLSANSTNSYSKLKNISLALNASGTSSYIKVFIWDENMRPLCEPYVYNVK